jgi:sugar phosphate isomerase/epimerase
MEAIEQVTRRSFLGSAAALAVAATIKANGANKAQRIKLGYDNFAVRAMGWKAPQLIEYAAKLRVDSLFITDLDAYESFDESYLAGLKRKAAESDVQIHAGTWSICPTSTTFKKKWGTAEEHLALGIRVARAVGSPVIRVVLGNGQDRKTPGGIAARIRDTVEVCKSQRKLALDSGVKIAVENHAGDMRATELVSLIESAGKDYVGVNLDSGNAVWTLEDPLASLETLAPYVVTTSLRDSAIWETTNGATVQWTAMGEGDVDLKTYFARFAELCPNVPVHIETISGFHHELAYLQSGFWDVWPNVAGKDLAQFLKLVKKGSPRNAFQPPAGAGRATAEREYQKGELERSIRYCKRVLGLGVKEG